MTKRLLWAALAAALLAPAGCRHLHLGDDTGQTYRRAVDTQRDSGAAAVAPMSADDAKKSMATHRGDKPGGGSGGATASSSSSSSGDIDTGSSDMWQGATGPIRLDAK